MVMDKFSSAEGSQSSEITLFLKLELDKISSLVGWPPVSAIQPKG